MARRRARTNWILDHLPQGQPSTILHGDLLPQNLLLAQKITLNAVIVHELLFHLKWTAEAIENRATNRFGGHGPEHYAGLLRSILGRAQQLSQE